MIKQYTVLTILVCSLSYFILYFDEFKEIEFPSVQYVLSQVARQIEVFSFDDIWPTEKDAETLPMETLFTAHELSNYNDKLLYLSILGQVFDVTKGRKYYGPGESYHGFTGRDGSKAFVTGEFTDDGLTDDVTDLELSDLLGLKDWVEFYKKDYTFKGKLIGRFYDEEGNETPYLQEIYEKIKVAEEEKENMKKMENKYPPCNIEWSENSGSRVWCTNRSGGVQRDWVGVPRKFYEPGKSGYRCACVKLSVIKSMKSKNGRQGNFEKYQGCDPESISCIVDEK